MNTETNFDMDSILDGTLDDLADIPEFKPYPAGTHRATIHFEQKVVNKHPCFEVVFKGVETVELPSGSEAAPISAGQEATVLYRMDNELGQGKFKKLLRALGEHYGAMKNRELIEATQGAEVLVVTNLRSNRNDKTKQYMDIVEIAVA